MKTIGVPTMLLALVTDEEDSTAVEALMMEALTTCMHPLGEHSLVEGQHPPPVASEH
jgi:hypothetical protein